MDLKPAISQIERVQINFVLKILPIPKGRPRFSRGHTYTPTRTRQFEHSLAWMIRDAYRGEPILGAVSLKIVFSIPRAKSQKLKWPTHKVGDLDNFLKAFCDSANGILWEDDSQVIHVDAMKVFAIGDPTIQVSISEI